MRGVNVAALLMVLTCRAEAQEQVKPAPPDVIVEAERPLSKEERKAAPYAFLGPGYDPEHTATYYEGALGAARCATSGPLSNTQALRAIVDGVFNSSAHDRQMQLLMYRTSTCGMGTQTRHFLDKTATFPASEVEIGVMYRGAFVLRTIERYAPNLALTPAQLSDPVVQQRFREREGMRNRFRVPADMAYLGITTCLVQHDPVTARRILQSEDRRELHRISARLIDRNRTCVGGARKVSFDPFQFRFHIADAFYRWALAALNVPTLIPSDEKIAAVDEKPFP